MANQKVDPALPSTKSVYFELKGWGAHGAASPEEAVAAIEVAREEMTRNSGWNLQIYPLCDDPYSDPTMGYSYNRLETNNELEARLKKREKEAKAKQDKVEQRLLDKRARELKQLEQLANKLGVKIV